MATKKKKDAVRDLTVITTHVNADFDALASMLAAQKLYPDARVVFPGSQEQNLRTFFISSMAYLFNMVDIKSIDLNRIKRLVLVDTRQRSRIGKLSSVLEKPEVEVHIYDHHPPTPGDIEGDYHVHRPTGANVTILTDILKTKQIEITSDEATILCLGIYEDTGSFTFPSTTAEDFEAAAFLLSRGANLNIISNLIAREISPEQVALLNDMIQAMTRYHIGGNEIALTRINTTQYIPDFALLVQKMLKMENLSALFAIALMGSKIYLVARSRIPEIDVGAIATTFGGGGHLFAAAATIKDRTVTQVEHQLVAVLYEKVQSQRRAKDLMSAPPLTVDSEVSCNSAAELLIRYNINALLVTRSSSGGDGITPGEQLLGFISRQIIEKALHHKLGGSPVRDYMTTDMFTVGLDSDLQHVQEKIIGNKQRVLPVVEDGKIMGVITRTDLLNVLVQQTRHTPAGSPDPFTETVPARTRNITKFINERLPPWLIDILKAVGEVATQLGYGAYVAGGSVRDLFLYRANVDIDIVIEGNGITFAKKYASMKGARIHAHQKFGTAVIIYPDGYKIDVASARLEYYQFPAALPIVEMSSIKLDLFRRDFTINTLAIQLNPEKFGTLIDFFSGQRDIKEKVIRVLHNLSFVEDPTRVFRAVRFEQRFGFSVGKVTAGLIENAIKMDFFKRLSGRRVFSELRQILEEENPVPALIRLKGYNLIKVIHPTLSLNTEDIDLLNAVKKVLSWHDLLFLEEPYSRWVVYFLVMIRPCDATRSKEICDRLELGPQICKMVQTQRFHAERCLTALERKRVLSNSLLYNELSPFKIELILYMMAVSGKETVKRGISLYFTQLRYTRLSVRGKDLLRMGLEPGPIYRKILERTLDDKLDGNLRTRTDEIAFARQLVRRHTTRASGPSKKPGLS